VKMNRIPLVCAMLLAASAGANGAITCTTADYIGTFAFLTVGGFLQLPPAAAVLQGPFSQAGVFVSDGQGNMVITSTASYNGNVLPANDPASYTMNPDCTMTINLTLPLPLAVPAVFTSVLSKQNRENVVMVTSPSGTVVAGRHTKLDKTFCSNTDFTGSYAIDWSGSVVASASHVTPGPFQRVGRLVSDGLGNFTSASTGNYNGTAVLENFTGTYNVNAACALTLTYTTGTGSSAVNYSVVGSLGGHGDIAYVMVATQGWGVSGTLKAQQ
jgi:hypothetical protein